MSTDSGSLRVKQAKFVWVIIAITYICVWLIPFFQKYTAPGKGSQEAFAILRDTGMFKWYIIPLFVLVINSYAEEIRRGNWAGVFAGIAFFLTDAFNEIWNGLFYTATGGYAAIWMCSFPTAFQPLMGWNIEIIFMFLLLGLASTKLLPADKNALVFGRINNRRFYAFIMAWLCVLVEIVLNLWGALVWNYSWWQPEFPYILFIIGYWPFFEVAFFVYDMESKKKQAIFTCSFAAVLAVAMTVFIQLKWI